MGGGDDISWFMSEDTVMLSMRLKMFFSREMNALKESIRSHKKLYVLSRMIQNFANEDFYRLLWGYYECSPDVSTLLLEKQNSDDDRIAYYISCGEEGKVLSGFFAILRWQLGQINYARHLGFIPIVVWGDQVVYYDKGMDVFTKNVFEYYFEPVSDLNLDELTSCGSIIKGRNMHANYYLKYADSPHSYLISDEEIEQLALLYKQYIHLNEKTETYLTEELKLLPKNKKTLGVHIRGTDFKYNYNNHPIAVSPNRFVDEVKELLSTGKYDSLFLATDDENVLSIFLDNFEDRLLYFHDSLRSKDNMSPHRMEVSRAFHHYRLGLEVLRDAYALANCSAFVGGLSQVAFAARYINLALDKKFEDVIIINDGINTSGSRVM